MATGKLTLTTFLSLDGVMQAPGSHLDSTRRWLHLPSIFMTIHHPA